MASADLRAELECSVCLNFYSDLVILKCGHNFCWDCIGRVLDKQEASGGYSCPECRGKFKKRPALQKDITRCKISETLHATPGGQDKAKVFCTYCIHTPVPAPISCLHCDVSLCDDHLKVHSKSPEHVLCDPTTSPENRKWQSPEHVLCDPTTSLDNRKWQSPEHVLCDPTTSTENRKYSSPEHVLGDPTTSPENRKYSSPEHVLGDPTTSPENRKWQSPEHVLGDPTTSLDNRKWQSPEHVLCDPTTSPENRKWQSPEHVLGDPTTSPENRKWQSPEHVLGDPTTSLDNRKWQSPEHVLCDPTTSPENKKCSVHKEPLKFYCTEDSSCICVSCRLDGEHRGHQVETLDETSEKKKKKLRNVLQKLMTEREKTEERVQSLGEHRRNVQVKMYIEKLKVTFLFRDVWRQLKDMEKRFLREINRQTEQVSLSMLDFIRDLEIKKEELSRRIRHIEELCNMTEPLTVLQESDTGDLCETEDGDDEDRERRNKLLHDGGDLDVVGISHTLHTLLDVTCGVKIQKCTCPDVYPHPTTKGKMHSGAGRSSSQPKPASTVQPSSTIQTLHHQAGRANIGAVQQTPEVSGVTDILLDVRTAGINLHISDDGKTALYLYYSQNLPKTPERFVCPQVMSSQNFSSGRHYWEVDVERSGNCRVGMCYPSIDRKGSQLWIGDNKKSWCLQRRWGNNQYLVIHGRKKTRLPGGVSSNRVRIDLDYEAGRISFYDLCHPIRHLHTFTTTFTEPLHVGIWVGLGEVV